MSGVSLTFRKGQIFERLERLRLLQTPNHVAQELGPVFPLLHLFPSTSAHLRSITLGENGPLNLRILQEKSRAVEPLLDQLFPSERVYVAQDVLSAAISHPLTSLHPVRDIVLASGHPEGILTEDMPSILGGLFVFSNGASAEIPWDSRVFMEWTSYNPFPPGHLIDLQIEGEESVFKYFASGWKHEKKYLRRTAEMGILHQVGKNEFRMPIDGGAMKITLNKDETITQTIDSDHLGNIVSLRQKISFDPRRNAISERGIQLFRRKGFEEVDLVRWNLTCFDYPDEKRAISPDLSAHAPQFFFFPGAVLEASDLDSQLIRIPFTGLLSIIEFLRKDPELQKFSPPPIIKNVQATGKSGERVYEVIPSPRKGEIIPPFKVQFGIQSEDGISLDWRMNFHGPLGEGHDDDPSRRPRIDAIPVRADNVDAIETYMLQKHLAAKELVNAIKSGLGDVLH